MDARQQVLEQWLKTQCHFASYQLEAMAGDASFRRYFRLHQRDASYVVMDAPPDRENCQSFVAIARALRAQGLCAPEVLASDLQQGFLLLTDFGDRLYLKELNAVNAEDLYGRALDALSVLQGCRQVESWSVPAFTAEFMRNELQLFQEWFLVRHLELQLTPQMEKMLAVFFDFLAESAASQPQVFMHRDYHSANLMVLPDSNVGILDFQDAFIGPVTYDLVSLLRDCYIGWPDALVTKLVLQYKEKLQGSRSVSDEQFLRWFDLMGMQRHLKALLTFSRKQHRDGNSHYLRHIPRTLGYLVAASPYYPECRPFNTFLETIILPTLQKVSLTCAQ